MNLSKLLKNFTQQKSSPQPTPQSYNLSQNYYPQEAYSQQKTMPPSQNMELPSQTSPQSGGGGLDIQSLLPLLASMNTGGANGLNIASLLGKSGDKTSPLSSIASILGGKKNKDEENVDLNKNSQLNVENFKKISDLDD